MEQFIKQHHESILGVLEGFDRVLFRGTLQSLCYPDGLGQFLSAIGVRLKDFGQFVQRCSQQLASHAEQLAKQAGRPYKYLPSSAISKQQKAQEIAEADGIRQGLICVFSCVEPCRTFQLRRDRETNWLDLVSAQRKCRFFYFYFMDREFGLLHVRLQSWVPFGVQVCINGRSYLQRQLDRENIAYVKCENCFVRIDDIPRAQAIFDRLKRRTWSKTLESLVGPLNPLLGPGTVLGEQRSYYWTFRQSEVATDVMFRDETALASLYPALCRHVIEHCTGEDVIRYFGRRPTVRFNGEAISEIERLTEGVRVRHRLDRNSIKMYDKQPSVLRIETTINNPNPFRVLRRAQGDPSSALAWRIMRKGISDTARRVEVSLGANRRYLDALAVVGDPTPTSRVLDPISKPVNQHGNHARGLRPIAPEDARIFAAILRGEHLLCGFTNGDLQTCLFETPAKTPKQRSRRCSWVNRRLRILRRHGLIRKVHKRRLYRISPKGHRTMSLALALRDASADDLKVA